MEDGAGFSPKVDRALIIAALAHQSKLRKGTEIPYIMHPFHVGLILQRYGYPEEVVVAGFLHDVVEDMPFGDHALQERMAATFPGATLPTGVGLETFREAFLRFMGSEFGPEVVELVMLVTEPKNDGGPRKPWLERRQHQLAHLADAAPGGAALKAADLLHNIRSVVRDLKRDGAPVMKRFNAEPADTLWWYEAASRLAAERLQRDQGLAAEVLDAARELRRVLEGLGLAESEPGFQR
jgi:(p)ppGpp synthase/HD superfamily hydrolase